MIDLADTISLNDGDAFELADGRLIEVVALSEPVLVITGDLPRLACTSATATPLARSNRIAC